MSLICFHSCSNGERQVGRCPFAYHRFANCGVCILSSMFTTLLVAPTSATHETHRTWHPQAVQTSCPQQVDHIICDSLAVYMLLVSPIPDLLILMTGICSICVMMQSHSCTMSYDTVILHHLYIDWLGCCRIHYLLTRNSRI